MLSRPLLLGISLTILFVGAGACSSGKNWVKEPLQSGDRFHGINLMDPPPQGENETASGGQAQGDSSAHSINAPPPPLEETELADASGKRPALKLRGNKKIVKKGPVDGRLLGVFRNTYYDFPSESDFAGPQVKLMNRSCRVLSRVPQDFHDAICVQGSGTLMNGATVSFAKRNCTCAQICPRTGQKICFDQLSKSEFPWGRGAQGTAITPLRTVAVDSNVIPLGTRLYILEFDGIPRSPGGGRHDGCFVAEDRGMKVVGEHIDVFSGNPRSTEHLNEAVPSNMGVHVYVGTARCAH